MNKESNTYTFLFALAVCVVCSFALSLVSQGLRPQHEFNEQMDVKKNILKAVDLETPLSKNMSSQDMMKMFDEKIEEAVINEDGDIVDGLRPKDIGKGQKFYPFYIYKQKKKILAYCFPVFGKGLWSTIYGYLALEADGITVRGITFYKHGETPGLGGEVSSDWFQRQFKGKTIYDVARGLVTPIVVAKGKMSRGLTQAKKDHTVDGISGATLTGKGVTQFLDHWIRIYDRYLEKVRNGQVK